MKFLFTLIAFTISSSAAFAIEGTLTEECLAQTTSGHPLALYLLPGTDRAIETEVETDNKMVNFDGIAYGNTLPKYTSLILKVLKETVVARDSVDDGCLQGHKWDSVRVAKVTKVSAYLPRAKGIKVGQTLRFACTTTIQAPTGNDCH
jgi:hypothetical protein